MLDGEDYECDNYRRHLNEAAAVSIRYGAFTGLAFGLVWGLMILSYALGFWYGSVLISDGVIQSNIYF
jgi:ATP-binding cassette subfamily B (MDR/TAP) protein 1